MDSIIVMKTQSAISLIVAILIAFLCNTPGSGQEMTRQERVELVVGLYTNTADALNKHYAKYNAGKLNTSRVKRGRNYTLTDETAFKSLGHASSLSRTYTTGLLKEKKFAVNDTALVNLLSKEEPGDEEIREFTYTILKESAYALGESWAAENYPAIREYWADFSQKGQLTDESGRINPLAVSGLYAEHLIDNMGNKTNASFHEFTQNQTKAGTSIAQGITANYPDVTSDAGSFKQGLLAAFSLEDTYIKRWKLSKKDKPSARETKQITQLTQSISNSPLPQAFKTYLEQKYPTGQAVAPTPKPEPEPDPEPQPENQTTGQSSYSTDDHIRLKEPERAKEFCSQYLNFVNLMDDESVWDTPRDRMLDSRLRKLLMYAINEELKTFARLSAEYKAKAARIQSPTRREDAVSDLIETMLEMEHCAEHIISLKVAFPQMRADEANAAQEISIMGPAVINSLDAEAILQSKLANHLGQFAMGRALKMFGAQGKGATQEPQYETGSLLCLWLEGRAHFMGMSLLLQDYTAPVLRKNPAYVEKLKRQKMKAYDKMLNGLPFK